MQSRSRLLSQIAAAVLTVALSTALYAEPPRLSFTPGPPTLIGGTPGTRVVWMGFVRVWEKDQARVHYIRGAGSLRPEGLSLAPGRDAARSIWVVAGVAQPFNIVQPAPSYPMSDETIEVVAAAGSEAIEIRSGIIHGTYVKRDGTTWAFFAGDADVTDAGAPNDGWIILPLSTLSRFSGNPAAPAKLSVGDKILLIDAEESRVAVIEVRP